MRRLDACVDCMIPPGSPVRQPPTDCVQMIWRHKGRDALRENHSHRQTRLRHGLMIETRRAFA
jgi:hypothetical protein